MPWDIVLNCLLIVLARIGDVTFGTLRTVAVIYGRRSLAWLLGFCEVFIWIFVVSSVIGVAQQKPIYAVFYAIGFATGNFIGITIEARLALGEQAVRVFTRLGPAMAKALRDDDFGVTEFDGRGRDGPVAMLFIETPRRRTSGLLRRAREIDPSCYYIVDDVRAASTATVAGQSPTFWRSIVTRR